MEKGVGSCRTGGREPIKEKKNPRTGTSKKGWVFLIGQRRFHFGGGRLRGPHGLLLLLTKPKFGN